MNVLYIIVLVNNYPLDTYLLALFDIVCPYFGKDVNVGTCTVQVPTSQTAPNHESAMLYVHNDTNGNLMISWLSIG